MTLWFQFYCHSNLCSCGSRISPRWGWQLSRGRQHTILPNFPKNCMKLKESGPPWPSLAPSPLRSATTLSSFSEVSLGWLLKLFTSAGYGLYPVKICLLFTSNVHIRGVWPTLLRTMSRDRASGQKPGNTKSWMQILNLSTSTKPVITKLKTLLT